MELLLTVLAIVWILSKIHTLSGEVKRLQAQVHALSGPGQVGHSQSETASVPVAQQSSFAPQSAPPAHQSGSPVSTAL